MADPTPTLKPTGSLLARASRSRFGRTLLATVATLFGRRLASPLARRITASLAPTIPALRRTTRLVAAYDTNAKADVERLLPGKPPSPESSGPPPLQRGTWMRDGLPRDERDGLPRDERDERPSNELAPTSSEPPLTRVDLPVLRSSKPPTRAPTPERGPESIDDREAPPQVSRPTDAQRDESRPDVPDSAPRPPRLRPRRESAPPRPSAGLPRPDDLGPTRSPLGRPRARSLLALGATLGVLGAGRLRAQGPSSDVPVRGPEPSPSLKSPRLETVPSIQPSPTVTSFPRTPRPRSLTESAFPRLGAPPMPFVDPTRPPPGPESGLPRPRRGPPIGVTIPSSAVLVPLASSLVAPLVDPTAETPMQRALRESRELSARLEATQRPRALSDAPRETTAQRHLREMRELSDRLEATYRPPSSERPPSETPAQRQLRESRALSDRLDEALGPPPSPEKRPEGRPDGGPPPTESNAQRGLRESRAVSDRLEATTRPRRRTLGVPRSRGGLRPSSLALVGAPLLGLGALVTPESPLARESRLEPVSSEAPFGSSATKTRTGSLPSWRDGFGRPRPMKSDDPQIVLSDREGVGPSSEGPSPRTFDDLVTPEARRTRRFRARQLASAQLGRQRVGGWSSARESTEDVTRRVERELELRALQPLRATDPRAETRARELTSLLASSTPTTSPRSTSGSWQGFRKGGRRGAPALRLGGSRAGGHRVLTRGDSHRAMPISQNEIRALAKEAPSKSGRTMEVRDYDPDPDLRWRTKESVLAAFQSRKLDDDDLESSPDLRRMLLEDLAVLRQREGRLDPELERIQERWTHYDRSGGKKWDQAAVLEELDAYAPSLTREADRPRWRRAALLARRATLTWWPTWVARRTPPMRAEQLVKRFADAVRIVELRAKPSRTPDEARELTELTQRESTLLRNEGSVWNLDKLLGREARAPGRLPPGFRGGANLPLVGTSVDAKTEGVPQGALPMKDSSPQVLLTSSSTPPSVTPPSETKDKPPSPTDKTVDQLAQQSPPPLPRPELFDGLSDSDFVRGGREVLPGPLPRRGDVPLSGSAVQLDRLGDRDLARLLARVLDQPGVGERLLERALASIETKRRRDRLREVR